MHVESWRQLSVVHEELAKVYKPLYTGFPHSHLVPRYSCAEETNKSVSIPCIVSPLLANKDGDHIVKQEKN